MVVEEVDLVGFHVEADVGPAEEVVCEVFIDQVALVAEADHEIIAGGKGPKAGKFGEPSQAYGSKRRIWAMDSALRPDSWKIPRSLKYLSGPLCQEISLENSCSGYFCWSRLRSHVYSRTRMRPSPSGTSGAFHAGLWSNHSESGSDGFRGWLNQVRFGSSSEIGLGECRVACWVPLIVDRSLVSSPSLLLIY